MKYLPYSAAVCQYMVKYSSLADLSPWMCISSIAVGKPLENEMNIL